MLCPDQSATRRLVNLNRAATLHYRASGLVLRPGQSAKSRFCELEFSDAAIGDLALTATTCRSTKEKVEQLNVS